MNDVPKMLECITGIDPLLPPAGPHGKQVLTADWLLQLDVPGLRDLANRMGLTGLIRSMTKSKLIELISNAASLNISSTANNTAPAATEKNAETRAFVARGDVSHSHTVTDFFGEHYGYIDQFNREFFCVFKASGQNHYKTLLLLQLVSTCLLNAYAVYSEVSLHFRHHEDPHPSKRAESAKHGKCLDFILDLVEEILEKYEPKRSHSK